VMHVVDHIEDKLSSKHRPGQGHMEEMETETGGGGEGGHSERTRKRPVFFRPKLNFYFFPVFKLHKDLK
jgi:hypothetical protein